MIDTSRIQRFLKRFIQSVSSTLFGTFIVPPFRPVLLTIFFTLPAAAFAALEIFLGVFFAAVAAFLALAGAFLAAALALVEVFLAEVFAAVAAFLALAGAFLAAALALVEVFLAEVFAAVAAFLALAGAFLAAALALVAVFLAAVFTLLAAFAAAMALLATAALKPAFCRDAVDDFANLATLSILADANFFADAALTLGSADKLPVFESVPLAAMHSPIPTENSAHTSIL